LTQTISPSGFFLVFFFERGCVLADRSPPSSRVAFILSLFAAALITFKGAESPDSGHGRMGVIGALVFVPSEGV